MRCQAAARTRPAPAAIHSLSSAVDRYAAGRAAQLRTASAVRSWAANCTELLPVPAAPAGRLADPAVGEQSHRLCEDQPICSEESP